jgi:uncharacterized membrane protein YdjX (TVP38/TMEM64 family)
VIADSLWGLCLLLFVDGATFSFATTPLLLHFGKLNHDPTLVALVAGAASAAGSAIQFLILRSLLGSSHPYMRRFAPSREKVEATIKAYPSASFAAILIARATPLPDAPLKLIAAAGGYPVSRYALAIYLGALPYYFVLLIAGRKFKPPTWLLVSATAVFLVGLLIDRLRRRGRAEA